MDRRFILKRWTVFFLFAVLITGCNKDEESADDFAELSFDSQVVMDKLPEGLINSTDDKAQECVDMIEQALDMSAFQSNLVVPGDAVRVAPSLQLLAACAKQRVLRIPGRRRAVGCGHRSRSRF